MQFYPSIGSWAFPEQSPPAAWTMPASAQAGSVLLRAETVSSTPVDPQGIIFQVFRNGVLIYTSACMNTGSDIVPIAAGATSVDVTTATGCQGGPDITSGFVSGAS